MSRVYMMGDEVVESLMKGRRKVGGRNLLIAKDSGSSIIRESGLSSFSGEFWAFGIYGADYVAEHFEPNTQYTIQFDAELLEKPTSAQNDTWASITFSFYDATAGSSTMGTVTLSDYTNMSEGDKITVVNTFTTPSRVKEMDILLYTARHDPSIIANVNFSNVKVEKGNKATDWTPAPEDVIDSLKPQMYPLSII